MTKTFHIMKPIYYQLILALIFVLSSCENTADDNVENNEILLSKSAKLIVSSNNSFAFDFIKTVNENEEQENYMVSPVSLSLALGMAYNGAANSTKTAFEDVMYYQDLSDGANEFNKALISNLSSSNNGSVMEIANSLWINENYPVKDSFIILNKTYYDAEVQNRDFSDASTLTDINKWVSDKTHEKIPTILDYITPDAVLYLINALYFNANWQYEFDKEYTEKGAFTITDGSTKQVDIMKMTAKIPYLSNELFTSVRLPYEKDKYYMTILLPNDNKTTDDIINTINNQQWEQWLSDYDTSQEVTVYMPKFKSQYQNGLNDELIDLGLKNAFSSSTADFSNISDIKVYISMVLQKTYIDVNESGTEASRPSG